MKATLIIPGDCSDLSPNKRLHFRTRSARTKLWREKACWIARELGWKKSKTRRIQVSWVIRRWQKQDQCQLHGTGALKACLDGLVDAGVVADDTEAYVLWGRVSQDVGREYRYREHVEVIIEEITDATSRP